ncbi:3,4-dihydroxy-2-butanone-4-phosphate synthase [Gordonia rubripertincta]|uniref:3,4-dihydroxy-2-butanone-4-phosphate synthase n=1 Tax=Gordonia rubripertincta TaxID=36822 RepID=A0ABT4MVI8_GORRU|nr:3,4-dihydroxy-2-butanone-4-phosphate synthase [Gordonia rubripertincta]MCZ4551029.1 3,4-dihydroxy-2-butanone-4-phosphate synthase [Gordonia rubripertincta]
MFDTVKTALQSLAHGGMVVVLDDDDRENEADLIMAAEFADVDSIAFFLATTSGFLCTAITPEQSDALQIPLMVDDNTESHRTAFLQSVDYVHGTSTGISAGDRAKTIRALADPASKPTDFARPGHVMPLRAESGGVRTRRGHTEAGVELCHLAGVRPAAVICELVTDDHRDMLRGNDAVAFARHHRLPVITVSDIAAFDDTIRRTGDAPIATAFGLFHGYAYQIGTVEYLAMVHGEVTGAADVLVRLHSECMTGDLFASARCDCGDQLTISIRKVVESGAGVIVYMTGQEGRGIGLGRKLAAYRRQDQDGLDTVDANLAVGALVDDRDYGPAAAVLRDLQIESIELLTNNPDKVRQLRSNGVVVNKVVGIEGQATEENISYLTTKRDRMGHTMDLSAGVNGRAGSPVRRESS